MWIVNKISRVQWGTMGPIQEWRLGKLQTLLRAKCSFTCQTLAKETTPTGQARYPPEATLLTPIWLNSLDKFQYKYSYKKSKAEGNISIFSEESGLTLSSVSLYVSPSAHSTHPLHYSQVHYSGVPEGRPHHCFHTTFWVTCQNSYFGGPKCLYLMCWWHHTWGWYGWRDIK